MTTKEFDRKFNEGEDVSQFLDAKKAIVTKQIHRVNVDFPSYLLKRLDEEARKMGVARTALIKVWLAERLGLGL
ncbi:MAG: CopG family transcriptional regulator [Chlamydiae bacterium]|nr:CopG family transcriptional regulator [Chlamydiota bacterium]MBI3278109.1 CopG family transcriptional regulator [Chlamydiota bacterium]